MNEAQIIDQFTETTFPVHDMRPPNPEPTFTFTVHRFTHTLNSNAPYQASYPHRHNFYQALYITDGQGFHVLDFESQPITLPILFFVSPGQVHFWQLKAPLQGYVLAFKPDFLMFNTVEMAGFDNRALFHSLAHTPLHLDLEQAASLQETIELLAREYNARELNYVSVVRAYLHILFSKIQRLYTVIESNSDTSSSAELVRRFKQMVSIYYLDQRSVSFYADQLGVSAAYLSRRVKAVSGHTAGHAIRQELILEAKRLLINTDWTVELISYRLAFNDPAYFGRFFKRETGSSPGSYRQEILEKYQIRRI